VKYITVEMCICCYC